MKKYNCEICNYTTDNKTNYNNHLHTKTHINNITPIDNFCCTECLKIFKHKSSLCKHRKTCNKNIENNNYISDINNIINDKTVNNNVIIENLLLKQQIQFLKEKKEIESKLIKSELESKLIKEKTENKMLQKQSKEKTKYTKQLLKTKDEQIDLIQKNNLDSVKHAYSEGKMNALTFVSVCYNKTPKMPSLPKDAEYVVTDVKSDKQIKYWIDKRPDFADEYIAERLLHIYERKDFANYICSIVFKAYRKDDPAEQTFWASDVSRLIYIVRSTLNQKDEWVYDKKGLIIKESIIDPLLNEVYNIITKYKKYMEDKYLHSTIQEESDYYISKLPILKIAEKLIKDFRNRQSIKNQILRVLAPMFFLDRDIEKDKNKIQKKLEDIKKQNDIEYKPPVIENNTIFDKIKQKKLEDSKKYIESSEDTEDFLNDPRVKAKMEREKEELNKIINKKKK